MPSVTERIKEITKEQPRGGFVPIKDFKKIELPCDTELHDVELENIHASLMGLAVDYLTRFMNGLDKESAFRISLMGAALIQQKEIAYKLLDCIKGIDDMSIIYTCKLVGYDVVYRAGSRGFKDISEINPNRETIDNIKIMVERSLNFIKSYGPIIQDGFTFEGGYTDVVSTGDGDFLTSDTLWDFKVTKGNPTKDHTLQLLMYYLMGKKSVHTYFDNIKKIGIYNPRKNIVYIKEVSEINDNIINTVSYNIIGYDNVALNRQYRMQEEERKKAMAELLAASYKKNNKNKSRKRRKKKQASIGGQLLAIIIVIIVVYIYLMYIA